MHEFAPAPEPQGPAEDGVRFLLDAVEPPNARLSVRVLLEVEIGTPEGAALAAGSSSSTTAPPLAAGRVAALSTPAATTRSCTAGCPAPVRRGRSPPHTDENARTTPPRDLTGASL